jgi:site-specific DNA-methyltransferase (adenine-specific)
MSNIIHHGDCLVELRKLADKSVDFVITSPPYNKQETANWGKRPGGRQKVALTHGYVGYHDAMPFDEYLAWQHALLAECWRVLKPTGAIFYNHRPRPYQKQVQLPTIFNPGLPLRQVIIWDTNGGVNASEAHFLPVHEWILVLAGPAFALRNRQVSGFSDLWRIPAERVTGHPAPFPLALARRILASVGPGGVVLDPFMGSGTTALAALKEGYEYIGIEQNAGYIKLAEQRIAALNAAPTLFSAAA